MDATIFCPDVPPAYRRDPSYSKVSYAADRLEDYRELAQAKVDVLFAQFDGMPIKVFLSFGAASLTTVYWKYLTNPEDVHDSLISLFAGLVSMLVLFLPPHVVAWWHQHDTKQRDRMFFRWVFGVCAVLLLTFGLACDAWNYEFLRWSDVGYNAINSYVDCRFEKALNDCCPAAWVTNADDEPSALLTISKAPSVRSEY